LPADSFAIYVTPNDYAKRYDDSTELFAFANSPVIASDTDASPITLFAYQLIKEREKRPLSTGTASENNRNKKNEPKQDTRLKFSSDASGGSQDLLSDLKIVFNRKLRSYDTSKIILSDTNYIPVNNLQFQLDTSATIVSIKYPWVESTSFKLIIEKDAVVDTSGVNLPKSDTLSFTTKGESEYGSIRLRFNDLDLSRNPVLQLVQSDKIVEAIPLFDKEWYRRTVCPVVNTSCEFYMTIIRNGVWDPGSFFDVKRQPEVVRSVSRRLNIRSNWDNEVDINLGCARCE
jgi:hypothetical protein